MIILIKKKNINTQEPMYFLFMNNTNTETNKIKTGS